VSSFRAPATGLVRFLRSTSRIAGSPGRHLAFPLLTHCGRRRSHWFALRNLYSITSSARSRIGCGTVKPPSVLRLSTASYFAFRQSAAPAAFHLPHFLDRPFTSPGGRLPGRAARGSTSERQPAVSLPRMSDIIRPRLSSRASLSRYNACLQSAPALACKASASQPPAEAGPTRGGYPLLRTTAENKGLTIALRRREPYVSLKLFHASGTRPIASPGTLQTLSAAIALAVIVPDRPSPKW